MNTLEKMEADILESLSEKDTDKEGLSLSFLFAANSGILFALYNHDRDYQTVFEDFLMVVDGLRKRGLVQFFDPIGGQDKMDNFNPFTHVSLVQ
jgi:hypothetical protein